MEVQSTTYNNFLIICSTNLGQAAAQSHRGYYQLWWPDYRANAQWYRKKLEFAELMGIGSLKIINPKGDTVVDLKNPTDDYLSLKIIKNVGMMRLCLPLPDQPLVVRYQFFNLDQITIKANLETAQLMVDIVVPKKDLKLVSQCFTAPHQMDIIGPNPNGDIRGSFGILPTKEVRYFSNFVTQSSLVLKKV